MINFWWVTRPKRKLNSIPEVLATFAEISLNQEWQGQRDTHLTLEEALEELKESEISKDNKIICLPDKSFIRIENDNIEIIGDYYMYDKDGILHKNKKKNLAYNQASLSILLWHYKVKLTFIYLSCRICRIYIWHL